MSSSSSNNITIITAIYNAESNIVSLCNSINNIEGDFDWIVVDGLSTDNSLNLLKKNTNKVTQLISEADFGIYDALNKAIKSCITPYYLVIGSDDILHCDVIKNFNNIIDKEQIQYDILTSNIEIEGKVITPKKGNSWLHKQSAFVSSHAVGTIFKKSLHKQHGYYSNSYPIAADQLFILTACKSGATIYKSKHISGVFSKNGVSSQDILGTLTESFRIQIKFENKLLQTLIFFLKVIKNFRRIK